MNYLLVWGIVCRINSCPVEMRLMRKHLITLAALLTFGFNITAAVSADEMPDSRLAEKVTIDCVNGRLYNALDRISAETKVTVNVGKSASDWQVRDYPVLVCARDLPLGTLLKSIADATHLLLSKGEAGDQTEYRIWRDLKRQKELDAYREAKKAAVAAALAWDWDALCKIKDMREVDHPAWKNHDAGEKALLRLVAELGTDIRDLVLGGQDISFVYADMPPALRAHFKDALEGFQRQVEWDANERGQPAPPPLSKDLDDYPVLIRTGHSAEHLSFLTVEMSGFTPYPPMEGPHYEYWLRTYPWRPPARPEVPTTALVSDRLSARYVALDLTKTDGPPFLDTKMKYSPKEDEGKPTYSDVLCAVSKATGYSIVAEGCAARYCPWLREVGSQVPKLLGKEITVRQALALAIGDEHQEWFVDEENKLILGRDRKWAERVEALVPEKTLVDMSAKLKGTGVDIDDLEPVIGLTDEQRNEWIFQCPEFPELNVLPEYALAEDSLLRLYFLLTPSERALAKSGKRVSLGGCDPRSVSEALSRHLQTRTKRISFTGKTDDSTSSLMRSENFSDPNALPEVVIWLERYNSTRVEGAHGYNVNIRVGTGMRTGNSWSSLNDAYPIHARADQPAKL